MFVVIICFQIRNLLVKCTLRVETLLHWSTSNWYLFSFAALSFGLKRREVYIIVT
jgi:hypothetical protein